LALFSSLLEVESSLREQTGGAGRTGDVIEGADRGAGTWRVRRSKRALLGHWGCRIGGYLIRRCRFGSGRRFAHELQPRKTRQRVLPSGLAWGVDPSGPGQKEQVRRQQCKEYGAHAPILVQVALLAGCLRTMKTG